MSVKIRLARGGSKKRPHYSIVAADSRMPRDGRFMEKLGTYDPQLPKDHENRVRMDVDKVKAYLDKGAQPTDRVSRFLEAAGVIEAKKRANLKKAEPGKKATERAKERADKAEAAAAAAKEAEEAAKAAKAAPAEAPAEAAPEAEAEAGEKTASE